MEEQATPPIVRALPFPFNFFSPRRYFLSSISIILVFTFSNWKMSYVKLGCVSNYG